MVLYRKFSFCYATVRAIWSSNRWKHHLSMGISNNIHPKRIKMWSKKFCGNIRVRSKAYLYCVSRWNFRIQHGFTCISLHNHSISYRKSVYSSWFRDRKFAFCYATLWAIWSSNRWKLHLSMGISNNIHPKRIKMWSKKFCGNIRVRSKAYQ